MKNFKKVVLTSVASLIAVTSFGQFTLSGEIRPRAEYRNGYKSVADSNQANAFFVDQRTRINLKYVNEDYEFFVSLQDVRVWGSTAQLNTVDGFLSIHEAWAKAKLNKEWGLKVGRQEIDYDDARIFGNVGWAQQARSHDAALMQYQTDKTKLDFGLAFNQASDGLIGTDYTGPSNYRDMYLAHFNHKFNEKVNMSLLGMMLGRQVNHLDGYGNPFKTINYVGTIGTRTSAELDKFKMAFNGYYQMGSDNSYDRGYSGYLIGLEANYAINKEFNIGLGYETQSGTSETDTTSAYTRVNHNFNPWFGTNHKFNGFMDYFYVGSGHGNVGLQDAFVKFNYKKEKWTFGLDVHMFMTGLGVEVVDLDTYQSEFNKLVTAGDVAGATALDPMKYTYKSTLGTEIDFSIGTKLNKSVTVKAGYSHMFASPTLYHLKGVNYYNIDASGGMDEREVGMNNWGYVMLIFKPTFLEK